MKRPAIIALIALAFASALLFGGCLSPKPFTQDELDRLSADRGIAIDQYQSEA